jgi:signal transduction histidine kinase
MTDRAMQFLEQWMEKNLVRDPLMAAPIEDADTLVRRLLDEARAEEISRVDLEEEVGNLETLIEEGLHDKSDEDDGRDATS